MFQDNKYTRWYHQIINNAKVNNKAEEYGEKHHVIPRSLGGSNRHQNIVRLTAREHYVCHWLLTKMTSGEDRKKMSYAFWLMSNFFNKTGKHIITSHAFETARILFNEAQKDKVTDEFRYASKGLTRSDATKAKQKENMKAIWAERRAAGWKFTATEKTKARDAKLKDDWHTRHTPESIEAMRQSKIGKRKVTLPDGSTAMRRL